MLPEIASLPTDQLVGSLRGAIATLRFDRVGRKKSPPARAHAGGITSRPWRDHKTRVDRFGQ
ncbi:MAG: hypothetical protein ABS79_07680 [Planctomycetes bacterium SCN 63-9]|nr:MAG: hypothetical protein ABS79_07680 [Planctomycetes bacterium SCN 63-9]